MLGIIWNNQRDYNEDRVAIILNITKPEDRLCEVWPACSFFGVYDGHGGSICANYLMDNLHKFLFKDSNFPMNPCTAIRKSFAMAENSFLEYAKENSELSGSCAILTVFINDTCYIANVGDSRAFLCENGGNDVLPLSIDHKPGNKDEYTRILKNGGSVYQ